MRLCRRIIMEKTKARMSIAVVRDAADNIVGYQATAYPVGGGALPLGPVCASRDSASAYMSARTIPPTTEGGFRVSGTELERIY